ncbi:PAS domain-containing sensor histidine kinase [Alteromonas oceanisediminis]|uniref:PAS domain-containing sensor histidine kinase n=1 Tax=Alteromonas oceanisediminis TaxID=2836180 RepID=UPI001BDB08A6|nr:ATP-binding protein [Alteromonas oceanisediminis]MBT0588102.1 PAS domain-containing protein [Alteromonas oceanisediminis]
MILAFLSGCAVGVIALIILGIPARKSRKQVNELSETLSNVFDSSLHGVIVFTPVRDAQDKICDFRFELINRAGCDIIGKSDDVIGNTMLTLFPGNKEAGLFDHYCTVVETKKPFSTVIYYDHDHLQVWFSISAVSNADGLIVTFYDVSELKSNEARLLTHQRDLTAVNQNLEQFAYIASHDLQEPLRKIRSFGNILSTRYADGLDEKARDYISRMQIAAERMQLLITDLLAFSRVSKQDDGGEFTDLNKTLSIVKDNLGELISEADAVVEVRRLPVVRAGATQMIQLFQNLVSNAIKYAKEDVASKVLIDATPVKITIDGSMRSYWEISVADNGIGFAPEDYEEIFLIFHRLHGRSVYSGSGIGLAICQKIVHNYGGTIRAESQLGEGARFIVQLPDEDGVTVG